MGKIILPGEAEIEDQEGINDISGIVQDMSNIEDTSFAITIDAFNNKLGGKGGGKNGLNNTCKSLYSKLIGLL